MFGGGASLAEELHSVEELGASPRGGDLGLREASRSFTAWRSLELRRVEEKLRGASQHGGAWSFVAWRRFRASQRGEAWSFAAWRCLALRSFEELPAWSSWPSSWVEEEEKGEVEPKIASQVEGKEKPRDLGQKLACLESNFTGGYNQYERLKKDRRSLI
ncbi:hypothetical protein ZIOFF_050493 [Zingiber officinale]|uniref:Uncharacterized protein n=1 Tax=Zingiber officinale TaxID=94328 RepID=A0A8J5FPZ8_ZINOF|nr:hypothetical protein ZIOFF_050493 [Zingiber officinale]